MQRHGAPLQFLVDMGPSGQRPGWLLIERRQREQPPFQLGIVHSLGHWPGEARRRYSPTVDRLTPIVTAICCSLTPRACRNLRTSRTFRIGALSAGIGPPLAWPQRAPRPRFDRRQRELQTAPPRVAGFNRNGWPTSVGIGGRIASESVAGFRRIMQAEVERF